MDPIAAFSELHSPAAERNKAPIGKALTPLLPQRGMLLELASGALQHALHIAPQLPQLSWQSSECDERVLALAPGYLRALGSARPPNLLAPLRLNVAQTPWPVPTVDAIYTANLLHIAPIEVTDALFRCAPTHLNAGGQLFIYGPFKRDGAFHSEGDARFDASLRARDPRWGIRSLEELQQRASNAGLISQSAIAMPANNWLLRFAAGNT